MDTPRIAATEPVPVTLEAGRTYWWCACGRSATQPFCDGSHAGSGVEPLGFAVAETGRAWLCGCRRTERAPFCDGTHNLR